METVAQNGKNGHDVGDHTAGKNTGETAVVRRLAISASEGAEQCVREVTRLWGEQGHQVTVLSDAGADPLSAKEAFDNADGILDLAFAALTGAFVGQQSASTPLLLDQMAQWGTTERPRSVVIVPGGVDIIRFAEREAIPLPFRRRKVIDGPDNSVLMRTDVSENARLGRLLAEKINQVTGEMAVCLPLRGLSHWDRPGEPLYSMEANMALFGNMTTHLRRDIRLYDSNVHINDPVFAVLCVETLLSLMQREHPRR